MILDRGKRFSQCDDVIYDEGKRIYLCFALIPFYYFSRWTNFSISLSFSFLTLSQSPPFSVIVFRSICLLFCFHCRSCYFFLGHSIVAILSLSKPSPASFSFIYGLLKHWYNFYNNIIRKTIRDSNSRPLAKKSPP